MCGIVAAKASSANTVPVLLERLRKFAYRGYDSAGIAREGSPLLLGLVEDGAHAGHYAASDASALLQVTRKLIYLDNGDIAELTADRLRIADASGTPVERPVVVSQLSADAVELGQYRHYMQKEIFEQPQALANTLEIIAGGGSVNPQLFGARAAEVFAGVRRVLVLACGTSYHAGLVARYWLESVARVPCTVEIASEYRYRESVPDPDTLVVVISQSGETADTLAALKMAGERGYLARVAVCNVPESSIVRESELVLMTRAGPEIGVASTKAFTTQLAALAMFSLELARAKGLDDARYLDGVRQLEQAPGLVAEALKLDAEIQSLAERFVAKQHALFLGRGPHWPVAMEGALKLKEISYIHAEAYAAGELKHGPLALVDADMPVIAVAPNDALVDKLMSNLEEVKARGGEMYVFIDERVEQRLDDAHTLTLPACGEIAAPILFTVPLQLLSYHVAVMRGTDVDQPRNLAKSVTVE